VLLCPHPPCRRRFLFKPSLPLTALP
jgi:hypothetical protein